jgi:hypothetical protein
MIRHGQWSQIGPGALIITLCLIGVSDRVGGLGSGSGFSERWSRYV